MARPERPEFLLTFYVRASGPTEAAIAALRREANEAIGASAGSRAA